MKKFITEFKEFISKGNVLDMAIGVIVGGAFSSIVNSLIDNLINPLIGLIGPAEIGLAVKVKGQTFDFGAFISAILNFLIIAFITFLIVKSANKMRETFTKKEKKVEEATTKICPYCKSEIDINATKCPHCTADLEDKAEEKA